MYYLATSAQWMVDSASPSECIADVYGFGNEGSVGLRLEICSGIWGVVDSITEFGLLQLLKPTVYPHKSRSLIAYRPYQI
jgi:hypothetical protein